jgi:hypothetical protein
VHANFIAASNATLARTLAGAARAALLWWTIQREARAGIGEAELLPNPKPYVGLHTPDSDAARWA